MQGQFVSQVTKRVAGGLIPSKNKDECLRQDLYVSQGCEERGHVEMSKTGVDSLSKEQGAMGGVGAGLLWCISGNAELLNLCGKSFD